MEQAIGWDCLRGPILRDARAAHEGRAMAEIIHDVALTSLAFRTAQVT
jgi:hypothetical protein